MNKVYLLLGGNIGNRAEVFKHARTKIEEKVGRLTMTSGLYETAPWGFETDQLFLNQVIEVQSGMEAEVILKEVLLIEADLGRTRIDAEGYSSRVIDIDILFYNNVIIEEEDFVVPHPRLHERRFTLAPLTEIAPDFVHPKMDRTMLDLWNECKDELSVYKLADAL